MKKTKWRRDLRARMEEVEQKERVLVSRKWKRASRPVEVAEELDRRSRGSRTLVDVGRTLREVRLLRDRRAILVHGSGTVWEVEAEEEGL